MKHPKKGILLVNLGTPDSPNTPDVRRYLRQFLMDARVIDIRFIKRWMLVNLIIAPLRAPKSAKEYQKLWEKRGSPLKFYGEDVKEKLQQKLGNNFLVELGMRYQNPSIELSITKLKNEGVDEIVVVPLFPQYASATTGSVIEEVNGVVSQWQTIPNLRFVNKFFDQPKYIAAFSANAKPLIEQTKYDHIVFSYHGLPERQIKKASTQGYCQLSDKCCATYNTKNQLCYRAQCFETTRLLANALNLKENEYTTTFQSRLGKDPWIKPYTDEVLTQLAAKGIKKVLAFSPAFIADCLETTVEVGQLFKEQFIEAGGEVWDLVPSLNSSDVWVECLEEIVLER